MYFNVWFKTNSRQWLFSGDFDAMVKRAIRDGAERGRISLLECEACLDHMRLRLGTRDGGRVSRMRQLTGASARLSVRAAPDIRLDAGLSHYWQHRHEPGVAEAGAPSAMRPQTELGGGA